MSHSIYQWIKQGLVKPQHQQQALQIAGERPSKTDWLSFNKKLLLLLGVLALAFGVVFFFAFNWNEMGRLFKFMVLQFLLVAAFVGYYFKSKSFWAAQALLLAAVLVLGALLALFGQTYQTGADPWQLFFTWAVLITPLVVFARSEVLWLVWAVLLNLSLSLYLAVNHSLFGISLLSHQRLWLFLLLNGVLWAVFECLSLTRSGAQSTSILDKVKLRHRWAAQVAGLMVIFLVTVIGVESITGRSEHRAINAVLFVAVMAFSFFFSRYQAKDLLLLTAWMLAVIVFVLTFLANTFFHNFDAGGFLLMAIFLIGMTTFAVRWIKQTQQIFAAEEI